MSPDEPSGWAAYEHQKTMAAAQHAAQVFMRNGSAAERENCRCEANTPSVQTAEGGSGTPHKPHTQGCPAHRTMPTPSLTTAPVATSDTAAATPVATSHAPTAAAAYDGGALQLRTALSAQVYCSSYCILLCVFSPPFPKSNHPYDLLLTSSSQSAAASQDRPPQEQQQQQTAPSAAAAASAAMPPPPAPSATPQATSTATAAAATATAAPQQATPACSKPTTAGTLPLPILPHLPRPMAPGGFVPMNTSLSNWYRAYAASHVRAPPGAAVPMWRPGQGLPWVVPGQPGGALATAAAAQTGAGGAQQQTPSTSTARTSEASSDGSLPPAVSSPTSAAPPTSAGGNIGAPAPHLPPMIPLPLHAIMPWPLAAPGSQGRSGARPPMVPYCVPPVFAGPFPPRPTAAPAGVPPQSHPANTATAAGGRGAGEAAAQQQQQAQASDVAAQQQPVAAATATAGGDGPASTVEAPVYDGATTAGPACVEAGFAVPTIG